MINTHDIRREKMKIKWMVCTIGLIAFVLLSIALTVQGYVDIEVMNIATRPNPELGQNIYGGMDVKVYTNITNNGTDPAHDFEVVFIAESPEQGYRQEERYHVDTINPDEPPRPLSHTFKLDDVEGEPVVYFFRVHADIDDNDTSDNWLNISVEVLPNAPDLVLTLGDPDPVFEWGKVVGGEYERQSNENVTTDTVVNVNVHVRNRGTADADTTIYFYFEGAPIGSIGKGIPRDAETTVTVEWKTPMTEISGSLYVTTDPEMVDINEENNHAEAEINIVSPSADDKYDFKVKSIDKPSKFEDTLYAYSPIIVEVTVTNIGYRGTHGDTVTILLKAGPVNNEENVSTKEVVLAAFEKKSRIRFTWFIDMEPDQKANIIVIIDPDDEFEESNEDNNALSKQVDIHEARPEDHPDLAIGNILLLAPNGTYMEPPYTFYSNYPVKFLIYIYNYGNMGAYNVPLTIFLDNSTEVKTVHFSILGKKQNNDRDVLYIVSYTYFTPPDLATGNHTFNFTVNPDKSINETDETGDDRMENNFYYIDFRMEPKDLPDPAIVGVTLKYQKNGTVIPDEEPVPIQSGTVVMEIQLTNSGVVAVTVSIMVYDQYMNKTEYDPYYAGGNSTQRVFIYKDIRIDSGHTEIVKHYWYSWQRRGEDKVNHVFYFNITAIDSEEGEINTSNNNYYLEKRVINLGEPDLKVTKIELSNSEPEEYENITIVATIKNVGEKILTKPFDVIFEWRHDGSAGNITDIEGKVYHTVTRALGIGDATQVAIIWNWTGELISGKYDIVAIADPDDKIIEADETNNERSAKLRIRVEHPDLKCSEEDVDYLEDSWIGGVLIMGTNSTIKVTVWNIGTQDITEDLEVRFEFTCIDDPTIRPSVKKRTIPGGIEAGSSRLAIVQWTPPETPDIENNWTIQIAVPPEVLEGKNPFDEIRTDNQAPVVRVRVIRNLSDLKITEKRINLSTERVYLDIPVTITADIENAGPRDAINVEVFIRTGGETKNKTISVPAGAVKTISVVWIPTSTGTKEIVVRIDPNDVKEELNESNNVASRQVIVERLKGVELLPLKNTLVVVPREPREGDTLTVSCNIKNKGETAVDDVLVVLLIDGKKVDETRVKLMEATVTFHWKAKGVGNHTLEIVVDPDNEFSEVNETNNAVTTTVKVLKGEEEGLPVTPEIYIGIAAGIGIGSAAAIFFLLRKRP